MKSQIQNSKFPKDKFQIVLPDEDDFGLGFGIFSFWNSLLKRYLIKVGSALCINFNKYEAKDHAADMGKMRYVIAAHGVKTIVNFDSAIQNRCPLDPHRHSHKTEIGQIRIWKKQRRAHEQTVNCAGSPDGITARRIRFQSFPESA